MEPLRAVLYQLDYLFKFFFFLYCLFLSPVLYELMLVRL